MEKNSEKIDTNSELSGNQNDVVSSLQSFSNTEETAPSAIQCEIGEKRETEIISTATTSSTNNNNNSISGDNDLSGTSINGEQFIESLNNKNNNNKNFNNNKNLNNAKNSKRYNRSNSNYSSNSSCKNQNRIKKRARRGKSKRQSNKPYKKTGFKFLRPKSCPNGRLNLFTNQPKVPYNTNGYLMEFHMPEMNMTPGRTRNSSLSVESDENYFFSLPEDEEDYLTKEFSSVYENARCESLEELTKNQLIQQYLQLEAKLDQLNRRERAKDDKVRQLEDTVSHLTAENNELRRKLDIKSGCQMMDSDSSDSDSSSSCNSSSSSSSSRSSCHSPEMMDSDSDIQIQPITNGVITNGFHDFTNDSETIDQQNGTASEDDVIYRSPTLSPNAFAPITSC